MSRAARGWPRPGRPGSRRRADSRDTGFSARARTGACRGLSRTGPARALHISPQTRHQSNSGGPARCARLQGDSWRRSFPIPQNQELCTEAAFAAWMKANHARETEIWAKIHKKGSGLADGDDRAGARCRLCAGDGSTASARRSTSTLPAALHAATSAQRVERNQPRSCGAADSRWPHGACGPAAGGRRQGRRPMAREAKPCMNAASPRVALPIAPAWASPRRSAAESGESPSAPTRQAFEEHGHLLDLISREMRAQLARRPSPRSPGEDPTPSGAEYGAVSAMFLARSAP